jgi:hypothetical protein
MTWPWVRCTWDRRIGSQASNAPSSSRIESQLRPAIRWFRTMLTCRSTRPFPSARRRRGRDGEPVMVGERGRFRNLDPLIVSGEVVSATSRSQITIPFRATSDRSHASIRSTNGSINRRWVPARDGELGGTPGASSARYLPTVRQSRPHSRPISTNVAPAACSAETTNVHPGLRIQDHEQGTLRSVCLAMDSRRVTLTRADDGSTRRARSTRQVARRRHMR